MSQAPLAVAAVAVLAAATFVIAVGGCDRDTPVSAPPSSSSSQPTTAEVKAVAAVPVEGMSCASCAASVRRAVKSVEGVTAVEVNLAQREAKVEYEGGKVTPEQIVNAINDAGFTAGEVKGEPR